MPDVPGFTGDNAVDDPHYARWSYERLLLLQPHVRVTGLWKKGRWFYAVCPDLSSGLMVSDGKSLEQWFEHEGRALGSPIRLVALPPEDSTPVPERSADEVAMLMGYPLTVRDVYSQLSLILPRTFPDFDFVSSPPDDYVYVSRSLGADEEHCLRMAFSRICPGVVMQIVVDTKRFQSQKAFRRSRPGGGDIDLIPARCLPASMGRDLRLAWEDDEDFWVENRKQVLASDLQDPRQVLPASFKDCSSCCLVNAAVFPPKNLRTYITLYRRVVVVMPLSSHYSRVLSAFRVTENDLVDLASRGRLQFALPQSLDRYPKRLLEQLAEAAPQSLLFSRRLAAATIAESRRRIPFLYLPFGPADRRVLLSSISRAAGDERLVTLAAVLARELGEIWCSAEAQINFQGAMATPALGAGRLLSEVFRQLTGRDLFLEFFSASGPVEWAAALSATVSPVNVDGYSEQAATELCASMYSGIRNQRIPISLGDVDIVVDGLFSLDNDAPILDVERAFQNADIDRLGDIARRIASNNLDPDSLRTAVRIFNNNVVQYEARTDRLVRWDLLTLAGAIAQAALPTAPGICFIPIGAWLLQYLLRGADPCRDPGGRVIDWLRGLNAWTTGEVVLVSRLRKKLKA